MLHEDEKVNEIKTERTQVHPFWISENQSQFAFNYLKSLSKTQRGEKVDIIRDALITGLLIHHLEPRMINLVKAYQQDLTLAHIVGFINRIDPSLTEHEQPHSKQSMIPLEEALTDKMDVLEQMLGALLAKSVNQQTVTEYVSQKTDYPEAVMREKIEERELNETPTVPETQSVEPLSSKMDPGKLQAENSPNIPAKDENAKPEGLQTVKKSQKKVNKRIANLSA